MKNTSLLEQVPVRHRNEPCCVVAQQPTLTEAQTTALADRLKAVGDPTRLRMLDLLAQQDAPVCVCDITPQFPQNQPTISHHLRLLRMAGLIETEKRGIWSYYWATDAGRTTLAVIQTLA
ncbi:MAG: metalloregulator ArsR/SmtB family transcription factor [Chloroflexota bacterium]|nr:metalloregulator ArsR/SmtB family transcription factor [Chloroflexota bacterium]